MVKEIEAMIECGKQLSASLDEYTVIKNRRLASVNLHSKNKYYSLGLVSIGGSLNAACATELLRETFEIQGFTGQSHCSLGFRWSCNDAKNGTRNSC